MKRTWPSTAVAIAFLLTSSMQVSAADLRVFSPPPAYPAPISTNRWDGFYIGGNLGGAWASGTLTDNIGGNFNGVNLSGSNSGFIGGAQAGYNWQFAPQWVLGVEGMLDGTAIRGSSNTVAVSGPYGLAFLQGNANTNWISTLSARLGYAVNNWLFYGKAGGGWVGSSVTVTDATSGASLSTSKTNSAWVIGAGVEYGLTDHLSIKIEYDHLGLSDWTASRSDFLFPNDSVTLSRQIDMVTVGGNYKF